MNKKLFIFFGYGFYQTVVDLENTGYSGLTKNNRSTKVAVFNVNGRTIYGIQGYADKIEVIENMVKDYLKKGYSVKTV